MTQKQSTPSHPLKLNFYEQPNSAKLVLGSLIEQDNRATSDYIRRFMSVELLPLEDIERMEHGSDRIRALRKIQMFWATLTKSGFPADDQRLFRIAPRGGNTSQFSPGFSQGLRSVVYAAANIQPLPQQPRTLGELQREMELIARFRRDNPNDSNLTSSNGNPLFDADDIGLLEFLEPPPGRSGVSIIQPYRNYHHPQAGDFVQNILSSLGKGQTVILDLGNAPPILLEYFSDLLSKAVFSHQVDKFSNGNLGNHFIQVYFEEAHNLFPRRDEPKVIYSRFAKEGAKYHIGIVYSTQSPSTIYGDLLAQTENFFIAHMSSQDEANALAKMNVAYESMKDDILRAKTPGYIRMLTRSHRFVVPMQANRFEPRPNTTQ